MNLKQLRELAFRASEMNDDAMCDLQFQGDTILALLDLVDLQHSVVVDSGYHNRDYFDDRAKALAAYDNFNKEQ